MVFQTLEEHRANLAAASVARAERWRHGAIHPATVAALIRRCSSGAASAYDFDEGRYYVGPDGRRLPNPPGLIRRPIPQEMP